MKSQHWKSGEAKAHFSKLLRDAEKSPQIIENRGQEVAVVLSIGEYRSLQKARDQSQPAVRFGKFLDFSRQLRNDAGPELEVPARVNRATENLEP